jgi:hypothetical protein
LVQNYNAKYGNTQPILLLEPTKELVGDSIWHAIHPPSEKPQGSRASSIHYDISTWTIKRHDTASSVVQTQTNNKQPGIEYYFRPFKRPKGAKDLKEDEDME